MLMNLDSSNISKTDIVKMGGVVFFVKDFQLCFDARQCENSMQVY